MDAIYAIDAALVERIRALNPRVRRLNLSHQRIEHDQIHEDALAQLTELVYLNVSYNTLRAVPESIGLVAKLQVLDISHNAM